MSFQQTNALWTSPQALEDIRPKVRDTLLAVPAFSQMSEAERRDLAANMVKVLSYIADPNSVISQSAAAPAPAARPTPVARGQADDPVEATKRQLSQNPGQVGKGFQAGAVREGVQQFGELVQKVDFPKFVGGLIKSVFQAIVESSIEQMRAYGELIANVAKTVDQFMADNITPGAGRDYLAARFPDDLEINVEGGSSGFALEGGEGATQANATVAVKEDAEDPAVSLARISQEMNINPPITDLSDADAEMRLVTAARLAMAKSRQQLLSSMVMLGINRIVVTDGSINAKVVFSMRATSEAKRHYTASMYDEETQRHKESINASYGSWFSPVDVSASAENEQSHVATVGSALDDTSKEKAEAKAQLSGDVRVNFKSDYLPLEKMATPEMMSVIQGNSTPYNPNAKAPAS